MDLVASEKSFTIVVAVAMLLLGGYVALFDFILVNVVHFFTRLH